jgi:hypothetical protein
MLRLPQNHYKLFNMNRGKENKIKKQTKNAVLYVL